MSSHYRLCLSNTDYLFKEFKKIHYTKTKVKLYNEEFKGNDCSLRTKYIIMPLLLQINYLVYTFLTLNDNSSFVNPFSISLSIRSYPSSIAASYVSLNLPSTNFNPSLFSFLVYGNSQVEYKFFRQCYTSLLLHLNLKLLPQIVFSFIPL